MNSAAFSAILRLTANTAGFNTPINNALNNATKRMAAFGGRAQATGRDMMTGGGILVAPFVLGAKAAIDFEEAFTGVIKTWRGTETQLEATKNGILEMSKSAQNTATANELSAIAESAGQLGIQANNVLAFTRTIADLGATTNLGEEAAPSFAKFANITRMAQTDFDKLGSTVVALGNNMATTEADIVAFGMRIAGAGAQVDIPQSKIMGLAAGLSSVGLEAEAGGTAISKTLIELSNRVKTGGAGLAEVAGIAKMSSAAFADAFKKDAAGATVTFIEGLGKIKAEGGNVFQTLDQLGMGEVRLRDTLLRASGAGDLLRKSLNISSEAWQDNTALTEEARLRYKSTASQMKVFKNNVTALAITVGNAIMPALTSMVGVLQQLTTWVGNVATKYPTLTKVVSIGTAGLGAFLVVAGGVSYAIGTVARIASSAATVLRTLGGVTKIVTAAQWLWNVALTANPIGAVIVAVVALGAAITALVLYWDELKVAFSEAPGWMKVVIGIFAWINKPILTIIGLIAFVIRNWNDLPGATARAVTGMGQWLLSLVPKVAGIVGKILMFVATLPIRIPMMMWQAISAAGSAIWAAAPALWESAKSTFMGVVNFVATIPARMWEAGKNIVGSLVDGMKSVAMAPVNFISGLAEDIMSYLPFSPAKQGPFKRIMDVQIVESIASTMKPAPMVNAMNVAAGQTMNVANGATPSSGGGMPTLAPQGRPAAGGNTFVFSPKVSIEGHADSAQIEALMLKWGPKFMQMVKAAQANEFRTGWGS